MSLSDTFVQVAQDGTGKKVDMELVQTSSGTPIYSQRARLVGDSQDFLQQLYLANLQHTAILRAILATLQGIKTTLQTPATDFPSPTEDDFISTIQDNG